MGTLRERLQALIDNPDDLSTLPEIIAEVGQLEADYDEAIEKIGKLHELNRKYLGMIPINDGTEKKEEEEKTVTVDDAVAEIMKGVI